jgi:hypothetical protein
MNIKIIDNFLFKEDFTELCQLNLKKTQEEEINVYHNSISADGIKINECIEEKTLIRLHKNYHNRATQLLGELSPKKVKLYDYSEFHIIETGKNYKFPIHDDTPNKLLSGVVYLIPKNNTGTLFYENKSGDNKKEIKWKQNRAVFFSRKEKKTWHSFRGDGASNRIALVYNLMTKNIKEVSKIENNNYYFALIRYKLNPYLYRLFGKTI